MEFSNYAPSILKWLFDELQESNEELNETERAAIIDFDRRKLDYKYFNMIETRERNNFNKQINKKKVDWLNKFSTNKTSIFSHIKTVNSIIIHFDVSLISLGDSNFP